MSGAGLARGRSAMLDMDTGEPVRMIIELYCGSCAFLRYIHSQLESDDRQDRSGEVWYMCVDCLSQKEIEQKYARWDLAGFLRKERVVYLRRDLRNITPARLQLWCQAATHRERILFTAVQASFDCTTLSRAGACNSQEVRTSGGGAVSLPAQYDSRHLRALCHTLRFLAKVAPRALLSVENPWAGYFKEHRLIQEMIEEGIFFLYRTDFCAAATMELDGDVWQSATGSLVGGVFTMKPSALLVRGVDPHKFTPPRCKGRDCRMVIPGTQHHAWVIQSKSPSHARRVSQQQTGTAAGGPGLHTDRLGTSGRDQQESTTDTPEELGHPAQQKVPSATNSRVPLGLWASVWAAHMNWVLKEDGYDHWCLVCQEGGQLLKCDNAACTAVQHAACSTQDDVRASPWVCEDCWMMIGLGKLRLDDIPAGATSTKVQSCWEGSDESDGSQDETPATGSMQGFGYAHEGRPAHRPRDRKVSKLWSAGRWVENESDMRGVILSMHHGYVQVRFGDEIKNCRRHQLTLLLGKAGRKRRGRDWLGASGSASDPHDSETSSGSADSEINPVSPVSLASIEAARAHGDIEGVEDADEQC